MATSSTFEAVGLAVSVSAYVGSLALLLGAARLRIRALPAAWRDHEVVGHRYDRYLASPGWSVVRWGLRRNLGWLGAGSLLFLLLAIAEVGEATRLGMVAALALSFTASERRRNMRDTDDVARTYSLPSVRARGSLSVTEGLYWGARLLLWMSVLASGCFVGGLAARVI